ncbi:hypothetical protein ACT3CE_10625 [Marinifilum sp. RC60d5]|uniref:hypothetical protein n=1 Tax=Marinifilum sp. RC60d5 TaxID=3458414 RepID=UPI004036DA31
MNYNSKNLLSSFFRLRNLLLTPKSEWERIAHEKLRPEKLFLNFAFPVIAISSIISAVGIFIHTHDIVSTLSRFFVEFLSLNIGLFVAARIIILLTPNFQLKIASGIIFKLVLYSASVFCIFHGLANLFSPYSFLNQICLLSELYFIRILWLGTTPLLPIADNKRPGFTFTASLLILALPLIFERMFSILF